MKKKTAYLHVGAGKTGTSAIQAVLPSLRDQLLEHKLCYPEDVTFSEIQAKKGEVSSGNALTLARLTNSLQPRPANWKQQDALNWLEKCIESANSHQADLLFSNEHLQFAETPKLRELAKIFSNSGYNLNVIFYVRTAIDYSVSAYLQQLKVGGFPAGKTMTLNVYLKQDTIPFLRTLKAYAGTENINKIEVRNYDLLKNNLVQSFISQFIPGYTFIREKSSTINRSLSPIEQIAFENIYTLPLGSHLCKTLGEQLVKDSDTSGHTKFYVDNETRKIYASNNLPIINQINRLYLTPATRMSVATPNSPVSSNPNLSKFSIDKVHKVYRDLIEILSQAKA